MDFDQLNTFVEVAKHGSFSLAGRKVFRSQSAVSAQIRQLEQEYGEKLFGRLGKAVRLTPAGEVLFEYANRFLTLRQESLRAVADQSTTPRGLLAVGANEATCLYVLPEVFGKFQHKYPDVQISIYRNFSHKILQRVEDGSIDVGVVTLPVKAASLRVFPIYRDRVVLMVSRNNPLAKLKSVTAKDIAGQPIIFPKTGFTRQVRVAMELPSVTMIKRFVGADLGVSLITASYASDDVKAGRVRLIPLKDVEMWRELGLVYRRDRQLPRAAAAFVDMIRHDGTGHAK
jgi:LysR family transcriptional regulator, low CO2-responsive transcriptional regulator